MNEFNKFENQGYDFKVLMEKRVIGAGLRKSKCPFCFSKDRERLIYLFLTNYVKFFETKNKFNLMHVAPELNLQNELLTLPNLNYVSIDLNSELAKIKSDITKLYFEDNFFDGIICSHVLEHISNDRKALLELFRVLNNNGWAIIHVPTSLSLKNTFEDPLINSSQERELFFGQKDHVRIYGRDYITRLRGTGFKVKVIKPIKFLSSTEIMKYGLNPKEAIYFCKK
ncbi:class I SAM-dependent methyltransferase [Candidatus Pacearchaeota archaeon]|nr:class I SAM-dependent methyltransferase [Candidatus Pacearchaeota archaeon]